MLLLYGVLVFAGTTLLSFVHQSYKVIELLIVGLILRTIIRAPHPRPTALDGGSAGFAGAKTCHAGEGLNHHLPIHLSGH